MSLLTIAEILAGEALVSPGGPVDRLTAAADEIVLWQWSPATRARVAEEEPALV